MLIKKPSKHDLSEALVTDESTFRNRRRLLQGMGFVGASGLLMPKAKADVFGLFGSDDEKEKGATFAAQPLEYSPNQQKIEDTLTPESKVTTHNNFYEFGTGKTDPAENAQQFQVNPWQLTVSGQVRKNITLNYDELLSSFPLEERIYRLRCVEAWSMVVPWIGFSLANLLKKADPTGSAKFVEFETLEDKEQMPGQASRFMGGGIQYPYVEGLRIDEAMHPLTMLVVGVYGKTIPPQNGAPIRLIVPWKYGFKSIKSIVGIKLTSAQPDTTWNMAIPSEYGFYANVNPEVSHPRWSQASERRITTGGLFGQERIPTLPFNGYADQVASLYKGMDLSKHY